MGNGRAPWVGMHMPVYVCVFICVWVCTGMVCVNPCVCVSAHEVWGCALHACMRVWWGSQLHTLSLLPGMETYLSDMSHEVNAAEWGRGNHGGEFDQQEFLAW